MLKKIVIVTIGGALAVAAFKGTRAASYARQGVDEVREWASSQVPPEREIRRLRNEVKLLDKDVMKVAELLARENVEVRELRQTTADQRAKQTERKELLKARGEAIKKATDTVAFGDRVVPVAKAKAELEEAVARYTTGQRTLANLDAALAARERNRDAYEKQLDALKGQKGELASAIDALEVELNVLKLQQMESRHPTDDTRLAAIKDSIRELRKKTDIERERLKLAPSARDDEKPAAAGGNRSVDEILSPLAAGKVD